MGRTITRWRGVTAMSDQQVVRRRFTAPTRREQTNHWPDARRVRGAHDPFSTFAFRLATLAAALLAAALAGCSLGPAYQRPQAELPAAWPAAQGTPMKADRWWSLYSD